MSVFDFQEITGVFERTLRVQDRYLVKAEQDTLSTVDELDAWVRGLSGDVLVTFDAGSNDAQRRAIEQHLMRLRREGCLRRLVALPQGALFLQLGPAGKEFGRRVGSEPDVEPDDAPGLVRWPP